MGYALQVARYELRLTREEFNAEAQRKTEVRKTDRYLPTLPILPFPPNACKESRYSVILPMMAFWPNAYNRLVEA